MGPLIYCVSSTSLSSYKIQFTVRDLINSVRALSREYNPSIARLLLSSFPSLYFSSSLSLSLSHSLSLPLSLSLSISHFSYPFFFSMHAYIESSSQPEHTTQLVVGGEELFVLFFFLCIPPFRILHFIEKKQGCSQRFFFSFIFSIDKHQQSGRSLYLHQFLSSIFLYSLFPHPPPLNRFSSPKSRLARSFLVRREKEEARLCSRRFFFVLS